MPVNQPAVTVLAEAFLQYPLMQYAFEGKTEAERAKLLQYLYKGCVSASGRYGGVILTPDKQGALIWLPSGSFPLSLIQEIASGMWAIPFNLGPKATLRLMNHDAVPEGWIKKNGGNNFGYIWCVGVTNTMRGKGYSRLLFDEAIAQMKAQGMDSFWLKTEDPKNVLIYQKLGFEVRKEITVKSSGLKSWMMRQK